MLSGVHCRRVDDGEHVVMENDDNQEQLSEEQLERDAGTSLVSGTGAQSSPIRKHAAVIYFGYLRMHAPGVAVMFKIKIRCWFIQQCKMPPYYNKLS